MIMKTHQENKKRSKIQIPRILAPDNLRASVVFIVSVRLMSRRPREGGVGEGRADGEGRLEFVVRRALVGGGRGGGGGDDDNLGN